ncbi:VPS37B subunit of ESCRT-I b [Anguilla rostrata]|uniref:VPS37B subunit of ESCRT-I b n=1 Tax=Anguilla rostrata TaxID=7938 RepID=UPI0030CC9A81
MSGFTEKLSSYTLTQLNELLEDDEQLNKIVQDLEETQTVQQAKDVTLAGNRSLAEQNLLLQPRLDLQKNELTRRYRCLQELFEDYQLRKSTFDHNLGSGSLDTLLALLQAEGAKIEEETENMADLFLDGGQPLDSFIDDYQSKRKLAHLRRVKIDRLREIVLRGLRMPRAPAPAPAPLAQPAPTPAPTALPDTNGSPMPAPRRSPTQPAPPTASEPAALPGYPYPPCPYSSVPPHTGYASPFPPQFSPTLPQGPPPHLGPQPGFILQ